MPRRRTSVFEKMFSDNRLRSIPDSEQQSTLCVEYWTSKILIELSGYKSLELAVTPSAFISTALTS